MIADLLGYPRPPGPRSVAAARSVGDRQTSAAGMLWQRAYG
ncbi:hypothetical protein O7627_32575 [Solwaraspora sp. WMMD1047]|nr:hypothetical protein [Solwaraspora sp. WMMD1047]MDG4834007.1 hypothetical protein [Solwaraspora sp. WMMD1047]